MTMLPVPEARRRHERRILWAQTLILLGLGAYFTALIATGSLNNYINLRFAWLSVAAAMLFYALGLFNLIMLLRPRANPRLRLYDSAHVAPTWGVIALVALPLVLGTLIPSQPLGAEAVGSISTDAAGVQAGAVTMNAFTIRPENRNVLDWLRAINQTEDPAALEGEPVDVIGFVYLEPGYQGDQFMTARFTISCCVADASAIGLPVQFPDASALPQGEWVRVTGTMAQGSFNGQPQPIVVASAVERIDPPANPYLYP